MDLQAAVVLLKPEIIRRLHDSRLQREGYQDQFQEMCLRMLRVSMIGHTEEDYLKAFWSTANHARTDRVRFLGHRQAYRRGITIEAIGDVVAVSREPLPNTPDILDTLRESCRGLTKIQRLVVIMHCYLGMSLRSISRHYGKRIKWAYDILMTIKAKHTTGHNAYK